MIKHVIYQYGVYFAPQKPSEKRLEEIKVELEQMLREIKNGES